jgi:hypothetical protein
MLNLEKNLQLGLLLRTWIGARSILFIVWTALILAVMAMLPTLTVNVKFIQVFLPRNKKTKEDSNKGIIKKSG